MKKDFRNLILLDTFWYFIYGLAAPFITIYFKGFGGLEEVGMSVGISYLVQSVFCIFAGRLLEKINPKKIFFVFQILQGFRVIMFVFAQNIYWVYAIQFFGGVFSSFIIPSWNELYVGFGKKEKPKSFGDSSAMTNFAMGTSSLLSGFLVAGFGYVPVFIAWGITEMVYGIMVLLLF